ncbi:dual-specificity kinase [Ranunculus cassubicifolius]
MVKEEANPPAPSNSDAAIEDSREASRPDLLRHVQAALKRHRPLGTMQPSNIRPRRVLRPQREPSRISAQILNSENSTDVALEEEEKSTFEQKKNVSVRAQTVGRSSVTPPSATQTISEEYIDNANPFMHQSGSSGDAQKKVQFSLGGSALSQQMENDVNDLVKMPSVNQKEHDPQQMEASNMNLRLDGGVSSLLEKGSILMQNPVLGKEISHPINQSSAAGSSCMTTISVHSKSAPALNSTTYNLQPCQDGNSHIDIEQDYPNLNHRPSAQGYQPQLSYPNYQCGSALLADSTAASTQMSISSLVTPMGIKDHRVLKGQQGFASTNNILVEGQMDHAKGSSVPEYKLTKEKGNHGDVTDVQSQAPVTKSSCTSVKTEPSKPDKQEKAASLKDASGHRKKNYDSDVFVKVNGKLYQKLGKIGSGGSSEVYKVITSDCTIYALKRIKLKGRDYSTAYGFCQEIEYLKKLKGKNNIIQLIDYEVTDRTLLEEVTKGAMNVVKDGRIREDGYIYMVLEYGEIDLAHMLSHKWKEQDSSTWSMDENWLRFYWQEILQAVNTIHDERIVHSDLKPANFLFVKGSLKLIDFGIAKAIMSDTTNIQRDSQVGTLSYMSPEAFMCNESDSQGNAIKCGRPSDIWSLGCILYQMVYGRTPFSEYKTFWAKFKVITDRTHEIKYGPVSNPWLLDLMKKCLAWERKDRWRIPELLRHPFLVPPIPPSSSLPHNQGVELLEQIAETYKSDDVAVGICCELQMLLKSSGKVDGNSNLLTLVNQHCGAASRISSLWSRLQERLTSIET